MNRGVGLREEVEAGVRLGLDFLIQQQQPRGCWQGEVKWNTMLVSQYVVVSHLCGQSIDAERRERLLKYFRAHSTPDGAWGMHSESPPYVFHTTLAYIALRLLGLSASEELPKRARDWLMINGGVLAIPTWGKFWLALLNLYGWEGVNPILPELWLLPVSSPCHPGRLYNHTRLIYLAMAYLYGCRFTAAHLPIVAALRAELYDRPFERINFGRYRDAIASSDLFAPGSAWLRAVSWLFRRYEALNLRSLRRRALEECYARIVFEVQASDGVSLSPVNGLLNLLALWDRRDPEFERAYRQLDYWSWTDDAEGLRFCGAHSHTWDTAFTIRAALETPDSLRSDRLTHCLTRAYAFLRDSQLLEDFSDEDRSRWTRDRNRGGWCFSDERHRWPVSDCTAEALIAALKLEPLIPAEERISKEHLVAAAEFILSRQNRDGGFGSFERRRGPKWLERLNPSEMFGNSMVEGSYLECTASCLNGLAHFQRRFPDVLRNEIAPAIQGAVHLLLREQRADGSWEGSWGVNFTYSIFFCVEGLLAANLPADHPAIRRASAWLLARQKSDGGWGEHWTSCGTREYREHPQSQVIMSAWATLTLLKMSDGAARAAIQRAVRWLLSRQQPDGDFPEESPAGVFFRTGLLHYALYKNYFPVWALSRYLGAAS